MGGSSDRVGRVGVHGVALLVTRELRWKFREQYESDWGIDAIVEIADNDQPTGQLIALQIKAGESRLAKLRGTSRWPMYGAKRHLLRWLEYSLPVLVVLYDQHSHTAFWQHANSQTGAWTPRGFKIDIPIGQRLDASSATKLRIIAEQWVPQRGSARSRALRAIATCIAANVPLSPTDQLWDAIVGEQRRPSPEPGRRVASAMPPGVKTVGLPLMGEAPAVGVAADGRTRGLGIVTLPLESLRGLWTAPPGTTVFVCENSIVINTAAAQLGAACPPMIELGGFPSPAVDYLMIGLGACGVRLRVHVDHDDGGRRIADSLFVRSVLFDDWRPNEAECQSGLEEDCLPRLLDDLTAHARANAPEALLLHPPPDSTSPPTGNAAHPDLQPGPTAPRRGAAPCGRIAPVQ